MKCESVQFNLSLYSDDILTDEERAVVDAHLVRCPLCRQKLDDYQTVRQGLSSFARPQLPAEVLVSVKRKMRAELSPAGKKSNSIFTESFREFLQMRVMPYTVGTVASLLIGLSLLWVLLSGVKTDPNRQAFVQSGPSTVFLTNADPRSSSSDGEITPAALVAERLSVSGESPSINPRGALVALTKTLVGRNVKDDEVVVVADVFSNGLANIEEVVEPLDNEQAVYELEKALNKTSAEAPFVPAFLDRRADSVRVVLKIQRVDIVHPKPRTKKP